MSHPLDPLTVDEIRATGAAVRAAHPDLADPTFSVIALQEPARAAVLDHAPGDPIERRAHLIVLERGTGAVYEGVVDPAAEALLEWRALEGVQPIITLKDFEVAIAGAFADERFDAALRRRGYDDPESQVSVVPLAAGFYDEYPDGRRCLWATCFETIRPGEENFGSPIENVLALVDVNNGEVLEVIDGEIVPAPKESGDYSLEPPRTDLKTLEITQPDGPSFTLDGHRLAWQNWTFHVALHPVEGLVIHDVRYGGRQVLYRAGLAEMVVPYGDPSPGFFWRSYFDSGEYGLGQLANSLELGCDCLGEIRYLDGVVTTEAGTPRTIANAICIHEEDVGTLWKHTSCITQKADVRRSRRLVVSSISTIGNYDYGFFWSFYQDGSIELEIKLTGMILTQGVHPDAVLRHARRVTETLAGPNHQHIFNVRLDMAVDGFTNSVYEVDMVRAADGPDNPRGGATEIRETRIEREAQARRDIDPLAGRTWKVVNEHKRNAIGEPVGYKLVPHAGPVLLASDDSSVAKRAAFARHHLWVTRYDPAERHAAGDFPNQSRGGDGLPAFAAADRDLRDTDVVLWHTLGTSHVVRPEDWPVMPVEKIGFMLKPAGFFDRNPALDVPPGNGSHNGHACH